MPFFLCQLFWRKHIYTAIRNLVFYDNKIAEWDLHAPLFGGELTPIICDCSKTEQGITMDISDIEKEHIDIMIAAV